MTVDRFEIDGLLLIKPAVFSDERGLFYETYSSNRYSDYGIPSSFAQDNESISKKNVLRGLHFQSPPYDQGKLVRVIKGAAIDVAVDIRKQSPTYGKFIMVELTEENKHQFWIPSGFAHGFLSLTDETIFSYKCTNLYNKQSESGLLWNDKDINIKWNIDNPIVSEKDMQFTPFNSFKSPF
ncbi:MAG: dTDP-4-dehydrorhamnose 3,5-epimerase [Bacteroidota bacterium]|jgi:dTDP-4-dehydrorhamnose 3,5-epimerase